VGTHKFMHTATDCTHFQARPLLAHNTRGTRFRLVYLKAESDRRKQSSKQSRGQDGN
jgi:hypothetical protein